MQTNEEPSALPPEEPQNRIRGVGETLRSAREAAQVSLEQAGEELRIEPKFLAALEEERYETIGIPVFAKGYLKLYCEYLGLDYRRLLPLYEEKAGRQAPPLKGRHSIERHESSGSGMWLTLGLAAVVLVLFLIWLLRDSLSDGIGAVVGTRAPSSVATLPAASKAPSAPASSASLTAPSPSLTAPSASLTASSASVAASPAANIVSSAGGVGAATVSNIMPAAAAAATGGAGSQPASSERGPAAASSGLELPAAVVGESAGTTAAFACPQLDVDMKFVQDSWVEVKDSRNARLYYGLGKAGEESHLVGAPPFAVLIGNADGVVLEVGGRPYAYPRRARGKVASFTLTAPSE
jgi:cytoskeleton protein RodZ